MIAAGAGYLIGSYARFLCPDRVGAVSPIHVMAIVSERSLCSWLLIKGVNLERWQEVTVSDGLA